MSNAGAQSGALPLPDALADTIARAYRAFPWRGPHGRLNLCHCNVCASDQDARLLAQTDPHKMPARLLAEYTNSAHGYDAWSEAEFKELLPRYFELLAQFDPPAHDGEYCFALNRLAEADYRGRWPAPEVACVDAFFAAWLPFAAQMLDPETGLCGDCGRRYPPHTRFADAVVMTILAGFGAARIAAILKADRSDAMSLQLAVMILGHVKPVGGRTRFEPDLLDRRWEEAQEFGDWLTSTETAARLEQAFFESRDAARQTLLSEAAQCCERAR